ncbi:hypothetical protein N7528_009212 [Penicillium herquei]|nr:hypothetical protein N7528_009212 [Penicillium herquei]
MPDAPSDLPPDQAAVSSSAPSQSHAPPNQADVSPSNNIQNHPPLDQVAVSSAKRNQSLSPPDQVGVSSSIPESTGDLGLKYDRGNTSIENEWYEYHDALKIKGDSKNTVILFEKGIKGKNGHVTHYGVQRRISEKYCFEMVKEFEVQVALEDWRKLTRRMTIQAQEREVMNKDRYGVLRKFWGCAYMTPKEREIGPSRSPYTECIIQTSGRAGFLVLTLSNFRSVEGQNRADLYVEETCLRDDIPLPWNVHPQFIRILDPECHRKPQTRRQAIATKMPLLSEPHTTDQDLDAKITRIVDAKISPLQSKMNGIDQRLDLLTEMLSRIALKMDIRK